MADLAFIALGSNLGDRARFLATARDAMNSLPGSRVLAATAEEETAPLGAAPQGPYLNQMLALETTLEPRELLAALHDIERRAGRVRAERWGPRTLDLDIVEIDGRTVSEPGLTVPHPELPHRDFWRRELDEVRAKLAVPASRRAGRAP